MQAGRLFELLYLLIERDNWTVNALSKRLEVSERTVRRDLDGLSAVGVPVYTVQGRGGGVRLLPGFVLDRSLLSAKEQDEILYGLQALRATGLQPNQTLLRQLSSLFGRRQDYDWLEADFSEWGSGGCSRERFELLKRGILERHPLTFLYYAADQRAAWRTVEPVRLCFKGISWYVQAWCRTRQAFRTFKLSRMEQVQLCEQQTFFRMICRLRWVDSWILCSCSRSSFDLHLKQRFGFMTSLNAGRLHASPMVGCWCAQNGR